MGEKGHSTIFKEISQLINLESLRLNFERFFNFFSYYKKGMNFISSDIEDEFFTEFRNNIVYLVNLKEFELGLGWF